MITSSVMSVRRLQVREIVLDSALHLFAQKGYFNTSIPDIVCHSGISTGSIYHHFSDKQDIARALYDRHVAQMEVLIDDIEQRHRQTETCCREIILALFELTEKEPGLMAYMLHARHQEFMPDVAPVCSSRPFQRMREVVQKGMCNGEIRQMDIMVAAVCVFGGALKFIQFYLDGILEKSLPEYFDELWPNAWASVRA
ncbi:MAG TPA: TetR/AcrR family transcriptional regulator [Gammaproteobacteria bacterium]|nr:TetR/AcrR family transcriptional regulator [Gammaproteobacteria bacterium]